jgi:elongation factor P hydroxylase
LGEMLSTSEFFGGVLMIVAAFISGVNPEEDEEFEHEHGPEHRQHQHQHQYVSIEMQPPTYGSQLTTSVILNDT